MRRSTPLARRFGGEEHSNNAKPDHHRAAGKGECPAGEFHHGQRARGRRQQSATIAPNIAGKAIALVRFVQAFDTEGVNHNILAGGQEGDSDRDRHRQADIQRWVGLAKRDDGADQRDLDGKQPAAPAPQPSEKRRRAMVYQWRPEEFQRIGKSDQRREADGRQRKIGFCQPLPEREGGKRQRHTRGKTKRQQHKEALVAPAGKRIGHGLKLTEAAPACHYPWLARAAKASAISSKRMREAAA